MGVNRSSFNIIRSSQNQDAMDRAFATVYEYCFYKLEDNKFWARNPFDRTNQDSDVESTLSVTEVQGTTKILGETKVDGVSYEVTIRNNIGGVADFDGVPAGSCRLEVELSRNGNEKKHTVQLNTAPLYDSSAVASERLRVRANNFTVASTDPNRNMIRSKGEMRVPEAGDIRLNPAPNSAEKGVLWAGADVTLGTQNITNNLTARQNAVEQTGGRFVDNSKTHFEIHDLQKSELKVAKTPVSLKPGVYVFTQSNITYTNDFGEEASENVYALERRRYVIDDGEPTSGDVLEVWYQGTDLPWNSWGSASETVETDSEAAGDRAIAHRVNSFGADFQLGEGSLIEANFRENKLKISANVDVQVNGNFGLYSDKPDVTPQLEFRDFDGTRDGEIDKGSLSASGEIIIEGNVSGSGKLLADGSVSLQPNYVSVESDVESDLAIFSGENVNIDPPKNNQSRTGVSFKGLIYAKENVNIDLTSGRGVQDLSVEGAIVAREGEIDINAGNVALKYNPDYLDSIVKEMPLNRVHLERAVWIP